MSYIKGMESNRSSYCPMPWVNLSTETNGKCKICCVVMTDQYLTKENGSHFEIHTDTIEEIWNSSHIQDIRKKMLSGQKVKECSYCDQQEESGNPSPRLAYLEQWRHCALPQETFVSSYPLSLEPRPGTTCNLKCNSCWSLSSSKVQMERKQFLNDPETPPIFTKIWEKELTESSGLDAKWHERPRYIENVEKCLPQLERLYFTGGEPFLISSNKEILKKLLESKNQSVRLSLTTNLTQIDSEMMDLLNEFDEVEISGSVDAYGKTNDYMRPPSGWDQIQENICFFKNWADSSKGRSFVIYALAQALNVFSLPQLYKWNSEFFKKEEIPILPTFLTHPRQLTYSILTSKLKHQALENIESILSPLTLSPHNQLSLHSIYQRMQKCEVDHTDNRRLFKAYTLLLDRKRGSSFLEACPELSELIS